MLACACRGLEHSMLAERRITDPPLVAVDEPRWMAHPTGGNGDEARIAGGKSQAAGQLTAPSCLLPAPCSLLPAANFRSYPRVAAHGHCRKTAVLDVGVDMMNALIG